MYYLLQIKSVVRCTDKRVSHSSTELNEIIKIHNYAFINVQIVCSLVCLYVFVYYVYVQMRKVSFLDK